MKHIFSLVACGAICVVLLQYRITNSEMVSSGKPIRVTEWDAFGYYMYLPAFFIYHDYKKLDWLTAIDKKYAVTGGEGWQAEKLEHGNYTFKYLGGVAILQAPFFLIGHWIAKHTGYPPDGFSPPYQYALSFGVLFYCMLAIFLLRRILLLYYRDSTVAITLILLCLASNFLLYSAVTSGLSHAYIFPLYVVVIWTTLNWHRQPRIGWAALTGYVIGLATISRPTEAVMLFIPLLWGTHNKEASREKWRMVKAHKSSVIAAAAGGFIGILPQLIYWKITTGSFIYDVGSKWEFLTPHLRVLFGWEKGWFIYTPVTLLFIAGMFFIKKFPFKNSVITFCLLNIWIIIAWHEWRYAASYSTRALVQSYPVFALPLAAFIEKVQARKWRPILYIAGAYLVAVNLFQVTQYLRNILHYDNMNRLYYGRIYLNPHPSPLDMSLLDNGEMLHSENSYRKRVLVQTDGALPVSFSSGVSGPIAQASIDHAGPTWIKIEADIKASGFLWQSYLHATLRSGHTVKSARVRLFSPISKDDQTNRYAFYMFVPDAFPHSDLKVDITALSHFEGTMERLTVTALTH